MSLEPPKTPKAAIEDWRKLVRLDGRGYANRKDYFRDLWAAAHIAVLVATGARNLDDLLDWEEQQVIQQHSRMHDSTLALNRPGEKKKGRKKKE